MLAIRETGKRGCLLARWTMFDCLTGQAYVSQLRPWEGSMVVERAIVPPYPDLSKAEDTPVVVAMVHAGQLILLDRPELYVYRYHGGNTWDHRHWELVTRHSRPLDEMASARVGAMLDER